MQNGIVKPEDVLKFAGNIFRESQRLIVLVNEKKIEGLKLKIGKRKNKNLSLRRYKCYVKKTN